MSKICCSASGAAFSGFKRRGAPSNAGFRSLDYGLAKFRELKADGVRTAASY